MDVSSAKLAIFMPVSSIDILITLIIMTTVYTTSNNIHASVYKRALRYASGKTPDTSSSHSPRPNRYQHILTQHREIRHDTAAHCGHLHDAAPGSLVRLPRIISLGSVCVPLNHAYHSPLTPPFSNYWRHFITGSCMGRSSICEITFVQSEVGIRRRRLVRSSGSIHLENSLVQHNEGASDDPPQREPVYVCCRCHEGLHDGSAGLDE